MGKYAIDVNVEPTKTQQSAKDDCDINVIIERAKRGADVPSNGREPVYGDFTQIPKDLRECLLEVKRAEEAFMTLDAKVRFRFDNDPAKLLDFMNDEANRKEAIELGLVKAPEAPPVPDPVVETLKSIDKSLKSPKGAKQSKGDQDE